MPHRLPEGERKRLRAWVERAVPPVTIVSSAEAVGTMLEQVDGVEGARDWLLGGQAIATHPRVAQRLHAAGFLRVETSDPADSAVIDRLESIQG